MMNEEFLGMSQIYGLFMPANKKPERKHIKQFEE